MKIKRAKTHSKLKTNFCFNVSNIRIKLEEFKEKTH